MTTPVSYELKDSVATITMNDGKVNVMSIAMTSALNGALDRAASDRAVVVLTGRPGVFSAGFDLNTLREGGGAEAQKMVAQGFELAYRMLSFPTPIVIACSGHAIAMGVFVLLSGDYRLGADGPFKIGANEVAIGMTMPHFGVEMVRHRVAPTHFNRAVMFAEMFTPADAVTAGFLDRVVPAAELQNEAQKLAAAMTKLNMAVFTASKQRVREQAVKAVRAAIDADGGILTPASDRG
ncbi:MAG TPA: crotonase/enoyl-CoA hydratase family protein [Candidatus Binatus sp.]|nr:crotonase/enoyl-CoA hydratase family protein [Candidatus Binatus sp.]